MYPPICKWCGDRQKGCTFCPQERAKYQERMMQPIFTARSDSPEEMEELKDVFSADKLKEAFGPNGGGIREIEQNAAMKMLLRELRKIGR